MKKRLLQLIMAVSLSAMIFSGCGDAASNEDDKTVESSKKENSKDENSKEDKESIITEEDIDIDELKENDGLMLSVKNSDWGEVSSEEDYWKYTTYDVYYDGTIIIDVEYNLSGSNIAGGQITDDDYVSVYLFGINTANNDSLSDLEIDACDGDAWSFTFYDEDENAISLYSGYTYGETQLEDIQAILREYEENLDFTPMTDGASNGYEYEYLPESGTWEAAYYYKLQEILEKKIEEYPDGPYSFDDGSGYPYAYSLCDITGDDIPELIIKNGTCEADYNADIYTFDGEEVQFIDNIWTGHSSLYSNAGDGMYKYTGHMGAGALYYITVENGELVSEKILEESGYDEDGNWDNDFEYIDVEAAYPGTKYIGIEVDIDNYLYLDVYDGNLPEYSYSECVSDKDSAEDFYMGICDNDEVIYAVGDGYMNDVGAINYSALISEGVMYYYMDGDAVVADYLIEDVDGNGSYECILYFSYGDTDDIHFEGILSEENGVVYCYLIFSRLSTYLTEDGYLLVYDQFPERPIFYKDKIFWVSK